MSTIIVSNLSVEYQKVGLVLNDVSFSVTEGDRVAIFGKNGSGETTLVESLIGLNKLKSGVISFPKELACANALCFSRYKFWSGNAFGIDFLLLSKDCWFR